MHTPAYSPPKALSADELDALRAVPKNRRDQALLEVMASCGLRVSEACSLRLDSINWASGGVPSLRFAGKRGRERVVPMNDQVQTVLRAWLELRGTPPGDHVFCNLRTGGPLSRKTVWDAFRRYAQRADLRPVHPHMLRHTFGASLADRDVPVERIGALMGHESLQSAQTYITVSADQKRRAVDHLDTRPRLIRWLSRQRNQAFRFWPKAPRPPRYGRHRTVGRHAELAQLETCVSRGIHVLLVGPVGVGKSHLLNLLEGDRLISLPSLSPPRPTILALAEKLYDQGVRFASRGEREAGGRAHNLAGAGEPPLPVVPNAVHPAKEESAAAADATGQGSAPGPTVPHVRGPDAPQAGRAPSETPGAAPGVEPTASSPASHPAPCRLHTPARFYVESVAARSDQPTSGPAPVSAAREPQNPTPRLGVRAAGAWGLTPPVPAPAPSGADSHAPAADTGPAPRSNSPVASATTSAPMAAVSASNTAAALDRDGSRTSSVDASTQVPWGPPAPSAPDLPAPAATPAPTRSAASSTSAPPSPADPGSVPLSPTPVRPNRSATSIPAFAAFARTHSRTSVNDWTTMVLDALEPDTWTLVIDDLSDITVHGVRLLDRLATRLTIAAATRRIRPALAPHFARFDHILLCNLSSREAFRLIRQAAAGADVEDWQLLETHVWQQTGGNPRAILESVSRLRKEPEVTRSAVRQLQHSAPLPQIDLTPLVIVPLLFVIGFRYIARSLGDRELYLFAGVASVIAMVALHLLRRISR